MRTRGVRGAEDTHRENRAERAGTRLVARERPAGKRQRHTSQYLHGFQGASSAVRYSTKFASSPDDAMSSKQHWGTER